MTLPIRIRCRAGSWAEVAVFTLAGFLSSLALFHGRAPFSAAALCACRSKSRLLCVLCGAVLGAMTTMAFTAALRHCAVLILVYALFSAFWDTKYIAAPFFRPLGTVGMCAAVEFAYLLREGLSFDSLRTCLTYLLLLFVCCHDLSRPLRRESGEGGEAAALRRRLALSAVAFRDLYASLGRSAPASGEENPAVVFDRAAEQVCRSCRGCADCWSRGYVDTFNALNDATPAMLRRGRSLPEDYPAHFRERCLRWGDFLAAVNREVSTLLLRRQYRRRLEEERQQTRGQFARLSEFLGQAAELPGAVPAGKCSALCRVGGTWHPKEGESVCGDVITRFETADGRLCLLLSDGMGSGKAAREEAETAVRLLEQFLKAGVEAESALRTVSVAMHLRAEDTGAFATADLLVMDAAGQCTLWKYGAAPTYLKRHGSVRRISGTALPLGLQDPRVRVSPIRFTLEPESFLLLLSDGMTDAADDEWLQNFLAGWQGDDPQRLAALLMAESRRRIGAGDDSSCLCLYYDRDTKEV